MAARVRQYQPGPFTAFSLPMDSRARRTRAKNGVLAVEIAALLLGVETLLARRRDRSTAHQCARSVGRTPRVGGEGDSGPFYGSPHAFSVDVGRAAICAKNRPADAVDAP